MARRAPLKVAFGINTFETGGTELNAVRTAEHLDPERVRVEFVCMADRGPLAQRVRDAGFIVHEVPIRGVISTTTTPLAIKFAARLKRERFDVFHSHDIYTNMVLVPWARLYGVPLVIASRRWWTETNHPLHVHLNRLSYRFAHCVLANSESVGKLVEREGVPQRKVAVIPNFVDDAAFDTPDPGRLEALRRDLSLENGDEVVGIVANLHTIKDHASLVRAAAILLPSHPRLKVVLVGDGVERQRLEAQVESAGLQDHVVFAGRRPHSPSPHRLFDVSVLCSRGEGFPNSIVEAMAAERPMVATAVGGVPDVVVDGVTGVLVPPGDSEQLAASIDRLLRDRATAQRMGAAGAQRAREAFNAQRVVRRLEELYDERSGRAS